jgi:hypothetical protein
MCEGRIWASSSKSFFSQQQGYSRNTSVNQSILLKRYSTVNLDRECSLDDGCPIGCPSLKKSIEWGKQDIYWTSCCSKEINLFNCIVTGHKSWFIFISLWLSIRIWARRCNSQRKADNWGAEGYADNFVQWNKSDQVGRLATWSDIHPKIFDREYSTHLLNETKRIWRRDRAEQFVVHLVSPSATMVRRLLKKSPIRSLNAFST